MSPTLYLIPPSPPVRAVLVTAKALGVTLEEKPLDLNKGEHLTPEFLKLNPQHTVPTLVDDGFTIWDSHAINAYLVAKYAKDDALYPRDLQKRAVVDQRLHFDTGVALPAVAAVGRPVFRGVKNTIEQSDKDRIYEVYAFLEAFLANNQWVAGSTVTIADYSLYATVSTLNVIAAIDGQKYPKVAAWLKKVDSLPEAEANKKGLGFFKSLLESKIH